LLDHALARGELVNFELIICLFFDANDDKASPICLGSRRRRVDQAVLFKAIDLLQGHAVDDVEQRADLTFVREYSRHVQVVVVCVPDHGVGPV